MERLSVLRGQIGAQPLSGTTGEADVFQHVPMAPADPILSTATAYKNDTFKDKVNLGIGAYRDDNGKPYVFNAIRKGEDLVYADKSLDKEYLPIDGLDKYTVAIQKLLFGESNPLVKSGQIATVQTLSGTGSLRVGFEFCREHIPAKVLVPNPTWVTHHAIIQKAGLQYLEHPYYEPKTRGLNFPAFKAALQAAKPGSIVLLHACAHNPTGVDPTQEQWKELAQVFKARHLFPFFDSAYQGFASGDLERDAFAIRHFAAEGLQMIVAQSLAKNFGMYGERIGALHVICKNKETKEKVLSQIRLIIRPMYSNPPLHGARVIEKILNNPSLLAEWKAELKQVSERIISMRHLLRDELVALKVPGTWDHIVNQIGMFSYTGLTVKQCEILIDKHHIYLLKNGRISMAGINTKNVKYLARAIKDAVESTASK